MQKFTCWYHLEDNSIRNNFGPSAQRSFHLGVRGPPGGKFVIPSIGPGCVLVSHALIGFDWLLTMADLRTIVGVCSDNNGALLEPRLFRTDRIAGELSRFKYRH